MKPTDIVEKLGPCASGTLIEAIVREAGGTGAAVRQRISRAVRRGELRYLGHLRLPSAGRVYYTPEQRTESEWDHRLWKALDAAGSSYRHLLHHMLQNAGRLAAHRAESLCGFPIRPRKGHLLWDTARDNLLQDGIIWEAKHPVLGQILCLQQPATTDSQVAYARFRSEQALALATKEFLRRNGLTAFGQVRVRHSGDDAEFGGYAWDITAPTYISPYASSRQDGGRLPGFWVVDCLVGRKVRQRDLDAFLEKIAAARTHRRCRPFTPMFVADGYEQSAFETGRRAGAVLTTPAMLLGEEAANMLRLLLETLSNPGAIAKKNPKRVADIGERFAALEGAMGNLRGDLFELLVGIAVLAEGGGNISVKREIRSDGNCLTDIDVEVIAGSKAIVVECKGTLSTKQIGVEIVREWFRNTVPKIRAARSSAFDGKRETYAFWTSGQFHPDALGFLKRHKESCRKYEVEWKDSDAVKVHLRTHKQERLVPVLDRIANEKKDAASR